MNEIRGCFPEMFDIGHIMINPIEPHTPISIESVPAWTLMSWARGCVRAAPVPIGNCLAYSNRSALELRSDKQNATEDQIGQKQRPEDVEGLGDQECGSGPATTQGSQFTEVRLKPDGGESQSEPEDSQTSQLTLDSRNNLGIKRETKTGPKQP